MIEVRKYKFSRQLTANSHQLMNERRNTKSEVRNTKSRFIPIPFADPVSSTYGMSRFNNSYGIPNERRVGTDCGRHKLELINSSEPGSSRFFSVRLQGVSGGVVMASSGSIPLSISSRAMVWLHKCHCEKKRQVHCHFLLLKLTV